jgi:hypothetical protein
VFISISHGSKDSSTIKSRPNNSNELFILYGSITLNTLSMLNLLISCIWGYNF